VKAYFTGTDGKVEVYAGSSFPFIISSGSDAVLIAAGNQTAVGSFKNPFGRYIQIRQRKKFLSVPEGPFLTENLRYQSWLQIQA
jgi:hypothetical protein